MYNYPCAHGKKNKIHKYSSYEGIHRKSQGIMFVYISVKKVKLGGKLGNVNCSWADSN